MRYEKSCVNHNGVNCKICWKVLVSVKTEMSNAKTETVFLTNGSTDATVNLFVLDRVATKWLIHFTRSFELYGSTQWNFSVPWKICVMHEQIHSF